MVKVVVRSVYDFLVPNNKFMFRGKGLIIMAY